MNWKDRLKEWAKTTCMEVVMGTLLAVVFSAAIIMVVLIAVTPSEDIIPDVHPPEEDYPQDRP